MQHFNERDGRFVPAFSSPLTHACNKNLSLDGLIDTRSTVPPALLGLVRALRNSGGHPRLIIGPGRSEVSLAVSTMAGFLGIPVISYSSTSPLLSSAARYPFFMRSIPTDEGEASAICTFWRSEMQFTAAAVLYAQDTYGIGFAALLRHHCVDTYTMRIHMLSFEASTHETLVASVESLRNSGLNAVLIVGVGPENTWAIEEAVAQGLLRRSPTSVWAIAGGASPSDLHALSSAAKEAADGSIRVATMGATETNPLWRRFVQEWPLFTPPAHSDSLPANWSTAESVFANFNINASSVARDIGTYMYDAVAAAGLLACAASPQGPLSSTFTSDLFDARSSTHFAGLTGNVSFDKNGDRTVTRVSVSLSNVLYDVHTGKFNFVGKATIQGGLVKWTAGRRDLVYNFRSTEEPVAQLKPPPPPLPPPTPPPLPPPSSTVVTARFLAILVIAVVLVGAACCSCFCGCVFKLRVVSRRFGVRPQALLSLIARRRLRRLRRFKHFPLRSLQKPQVPRGTSSSLELPLQGHEQLRTLFRKYSGDDARMVLGDWLRFCREQQKEADEAAATEAFLRVVTGADLAHVEPSHASGQTFRLRNVIKHFTIARQSDTQSFRRPRASVGIDECSHSPAGQGLLQRSSLASFSSKAVHAQRGSCAQKVPFNSVFGSAAHDGNSVSTKNAGSTPPRFRLSNVLHSSLAQARGLNGQRSSTRSSVGQSTVGKAEAAASLRFEEFARFILSGDNKVACPNILAPQGSLDKPFGNYWIASSHNTYLTGHQLTSESTADMYRRQLLQGCRCVEIDIWDGARGDPDVTHGYTLVTREKLSAVVAAIWQEAFTVSDTPLIISLEVRCSPKQQARAAQIISSRLGDLLFKPADEGAGELMYLPVEMLKRRIILKGKSAEGRRLTRALLGETLVDRAEKPMASELPRSNWLRSNRPRMCVAAPTSI
uniref:Phosphoinositide phospholipase C n=1 Tax=Chrysotila carterae TaxID=13221 RepID=A0A7S4F923_CHRCT